MINQSRIDPTRKTVGAIYNEAQKNCSDAFVVNGDLTRELTTSLVDDLNETIESDPFDGKPFYITVYEKKDLQMKRAILRRLYVSKYRPYPEDDTLVFYVEPRSNNVKFCWCLPHSSEMDNILLNFLDYDKNLVEDIRAWKSENLEHFGFRRKGQDVVDLENNRDYSLNKPEMMIKVS